MKFSHIPYRQVQSTRLWGLPKPVTGDLDHMFRNVGCVDVISTVGEGIGVSSSSTSYVSYSDDFSRRKQSKQFFNVVAFLFIILVVVENVVIATIFFPKLRQWSHI